MVIVCSICFFQLLTEITKTIAILAAIIGARSEFSLERKLT